MVLICSIKATTALSLIKMTLVFVYGTLLQGLERHTALGDSVFVGPAIMGGAKLYDLGTYPGVVQGEGEVTGELYRVNQATLAKLDAIEGYKSEAPQASLYIRSQHQVRLFATGESVQAQVYIFNGSLQEAKPIAVEDYRRYRVESSYQHQWMLAYGSNLSTQRLEARVGACPRFQVANLAGYELVFNKRGDAHNVYANIRYVGEGQCPGVAYELTPRQLTALDPYERGYVRIAVPVQSITGETLLVQLYLTHPDDLCPESAPQPEYEHHIAIGYQEHNLALAPLTSALARAA